MSISVARQLASLLDEVFSLLSDIVQKRHEPATLEIQTDEVYTMLADFLEFFKAHGDIATQKDGKAAIASLTDSVDRAEALHILTKCLDKRRESTADELTSFERAYVELHWSLWRLGKSLLDW